MAKKKPEVQKYMFSQINEIFGYQNDSNQATIILSDDIKQETVSSAIEDILNINYVEEGRPELINILISSRGGDMDAAIALINVIRGSVVPVRTIALGYCESAALCILMSGHQRVITPWVTLMSHQFSTGVQGSYTDLKNAAVAFNDYYAKMVDIYATFTELPKAQIEAELLNHADVYLTPEKAISYNIADVFCTLD